MNRNEYLAREKSKEIIREVFSYYEKVHKASKEQAKLSSLSHKKLSKTLLNHCNEKKHYVFLEDRFQNKTSWQILWGEWSIGGVRSISNLDSFTYDKLLFDLTFNGKKFSRFKFFYVELTKHALIRIIMRSRTAIDYASDVHAFLERLTKDIVRAGLHLHSGGTGKVLESNGFYLPLAANIGMNRIGHPVMSISIKTVMPDHFKIKNNDLIDLSEIKDSFFDYEYLFPKA